MKPAWLLMGLLIAHSPTALIAQEEFPTPELTVKPGEEWRDDVDAARDTGRYDLFFLFRGGEIEAEKEMVRQRVALQKAEAERDLAKLISERLTRLAETGAFGKEDIEEAQVRYFKAQRNVERATLIKEKTERLVDIARISRISTTDQVDRTKELGRNYFRLWQVNCSLDFITLEVLGAEANLADAKLRRTQRIFEENRNAVAEWDLLEKKAARKIRFLDVAQQELVVKHCQDLEILDTSKTVKTWVSQF